MTKNHHKSVEVQLELIVQILQRFVVVLTILSHRERNLGPLLALKALDKQSILLVYGLNIDGTGVKAEKLELP